VVFNPGMRRHAALVAVTALLATPAAARARVIELGSTDAVPACPGSPCLAASRTTGYQVTVGGHRGRFTVPEDGRVVAWSIALGNPTRRQVAYFNRRLGGQASAQVSVLRLGRRQSARVVAASPVVKLAPYFGQTVQFPLDRTLRARKGYVVALTVPTWAPALTHLRRDGSTWRASRAAKHCNDTTTQTAQQHVRDLAHYRCLYRARLTYSATLVTLPRRGG
jgi:hypothetical protein